MGRVRRALATIDTTLLGRLTLGPWLVVARCWRAEAARIAAGDARYLRTWLLHAVMVTLLLGAIEWFGLPAWQYILLFAWPGLSLTLQRSYHEHRPAEDNARATAVVEAGPLFSLLYLNNNFHSVHHAHPGLAWYRIPALYRASREAWLAGNDGFVFSSYGALWRRHALTTRSPVHPAAS